MSGHYIVRYSRCQGVKVLGRQGVLIACVSVSECQCFMVSWCQDVRDGQRRSVMVRDGQRRSVMVSDGQ